MALAETAYGRFFYFQPDDIGRRIAAGEFFDSHLRPYMDDLNMGDVLVDVGANIGFFSIYAALKRQASVVAFEASPQVFLLLKKNVEENLLQDSIKLWNVALYDRETRLKINPEWKDWVASSDGQINYEESPNSGGLSLVPDSEGQFLAKPLDAFEIEKVSLLKVDTQGADLRVLVGAKNTIQRCRPTICFEFEHNGCGRNASGDSLDDFRRFLDKLDYRVSPAGPDYVARPR